MSKMGKNLNFEQQFTHVDADLSHQFEMHLSTLSICCVFTALLVFEFGTFWQHAGNGGDFQLQISIFSICFPSVRHGAN